MKSLRINLYVKADKKSMNDLVPIYVKIIYLGSKTTYNTGLKANHQRWGKTLQLTKSKLPTEIAIREQLDTLIHDLRQICEKLESKNMPFGAQTIKQVYVSNDDLLLGGDIMLSELFDKHHQTFEPLVESGVRAQETLRKYQTLRNHVYDFIDDELKLHDVPLKNLNYSFIESFDLYLRKDKGIGNNTTVKYVQTFRSLMNVAVKYDWLLKDPFIMYDKKVKVKDAVFLTESELAAIERLKLYTKRLEVARDVFVFACYTGYAPVDIQKLTWDNIVLGNDKQKWIITKRQKTGVQSDVPLLPQAERIIEKYKHNPLCIESRALLPPRSTQKMNEYLKEIAEKARITKSLHLYIARHTFACTVILANGLSVEVLSKMMGHTSLKQTLHYGKIQNARVSEEMKILRNKFLK